MAEEVGTSLSGDGQLTQNDILDALKDDVVEDEPEESTEEETQGEEEKPEDESEEEPADDEEEEKKIELNDEDPDIEYHDVPNRQAILKAYPELFKKFPGIERAIYRETEYTKLFPSINEARQAQERLNDFSRLENEVFSGNIAGLLSSVKSADPKAFGKIGGTLLQTLSQVDKDTYFNTVNYVLKSAIKAAFDSGKQLNSEDGEQLQIAAQLLHRYIYNSPEVTPPEVMKFENEDPRANELSKREMEFNERQLSTAVDDVRSRTESQIKAAVDKYIDPQGKMSGYTKSNAVRDVLSAVNNDLMSDPRFRGHLDRLWKDAQKSNYSEESKRRIREAVIKKAQSTLPGFIKSVRAKALKNSSSVKRVAKKTEQPTQRRTAPPSNNSREKMSGNSVRSILKALE